MNNSRKFAERHLTQSRARMASDLPSDWYSAENQRLYILEFFNRIPLKAAISLIMNWTAASDPDCVKTRLSGYSPSCITISEHLSTT